MLCARRPGQSSLRAVVGASECERTCIWCPKSYEGSINAAKSMVAVKCTHLQANLAQVAQSPHERRHGGGVLSYGGRCRMLQLAMNDAKCHWH